MDTRTLHDHLRGAVGAFLAGLLTESELRLTMARYEVATKGDAGDLADSLWLALAEYDDFGDRERFREEVRAAYEEAADARS